MSRETLNTLNNRKEIRPRILGGEGLGASPFITCSMGFFARNATAENLIYAVTAGHCFKNSIIVYHRAWKDYGNATTIGIVESVNKPYDYGLIRVMGENINPLPIIRNSDSKQFKELLINSDVSVSSSGAHLCKSGYFSYVTCGRVRALDGFHKVSDTTVEHSIITDGVSFKGDSGGSVFSYSNFKR
ncbi:S1 family peptidase [Gigaspora margarita]|uniref:S1 family peptidase n=1 Tax=Gigaspora margarita TaxID=4874 RepID=A0A8H4ADL6_GIGMA|nr:S1 family peptidase [Gigaspora margarita]